MKNIIFLTFICLIPFLSEARKYDISISPPLFQNTGITWVDPNFGLYGDCIWAEKNLTVRVGDTVSFYAFTDGIDNWSTCGGPFFRLFINGNLITSITHFDVNVILLHEQVVTENFNFSLESERSYGSSCDVTKSSLIEGTVFTENAEPNLSFSDLEASYNLDGDAIDLTNNNHDGNVFNGTTTIDRFGNNGAISLQGTQYIDLNDGIYIPATSFSISFWFKINDINTNVDLIKFNDQFGDQFGFSFSNNNILHYFFGGYVNHFNQGFKTEADINTNPLGLNQWHHIVFTAQKAPINSNCPNGYPYTPYGWGGPWYAVYFDGVMTMQELYSSAYCVYNSSDSESAFDHMRIESIFNKVLSPIIGGNGFNGAIDDLNIWNKELNMSEVSMVFNNAIIGINESVENHFSISPNPTNNKLNINSNYQGEYQILDLSGRTLIITTQKQIDLSQLADGQYILKAGAHTQKIIKL